MSGGLHGAHSPSLKPRPPRPGLNLQGQMNLKFMTMRGIGWRDKPRDGQHRSIRFHLYEVSESPFAWFSSRLEFHGVSVEGWTFHCWSCFIAIKLLGNWGPLIGELGEDCPKHAIRHARNPFSKISCWPWNGVANSAAHCAKVLVPNSRKLGGTRRNKGYEA